MDTVEISDGYTSEVIEVGYIVIGEGGGGTGPQGPKGDPGDSAYEIAVANGFVGSEAAWLASLEGPQGPPGADGSDADVTAHEAALDPHPQYLTQAEADVRYEPNGGGGGTFETPEGAQQKVDDGIAAHEAESNPHPIYLTATEGNAAYATATHDHDADYQPIGDYALSNHNHTGVYQPVGSYSLTTHNHDADYADIDHTHTGMETTTGAQAKADQAETDANAYTDSALATHVAAANPHPDYLTFDEASAAFAASGHNHDAVYAALNHNHTGVYSPIGHNHDGVYQPAGSYSLSTHNHDAAYSAIGHDHDEDYQPIGNYALADHTHAGGGSGVPTDSTITADPVAPLLVHRRNYAVDADSQDIMQFYVNGALGAWFNEWGAFRAKPIYNWDAAIRVIAHATQVENIIEYENTNRTQTLWAIGPDGATYQGNGSAAAVKMNPVLVLSAAAAVPAGTPAGTVVLRTA